MENLWRSRLRDAKLRYEFAKNYVNEIRQERKDDGGIPSPDGSLAYLQALATESLAWVQYQHVLGIFTALTLDGKIPDENDWPPPIPEADDLASSGR